jgi:hypothetical protein
MIWASLSSSKDVRSAGKHHPSVQSRRTPLASAAWPDPGGACHPRDHIAESDFFHPGRDEARETNAARFATIGILLGRSIFFRHEARSV